MIKKTSEAVSAEHHTNLFPLPWSSAGLLRAYLGEIERSDCAVVIQKNVNSVQSPGTFSQKT